MTRKPSIIMTQAGIGVFASLVPHWHACIKGPVPFGQLDPFMMEVDGLIRETREEAEEAIWDHIKGACAAYSTIFDEDDWEILHLLPVNTS